MYLGALKVLNSNNEEVTIDLTDLVWNDELLNGKKAFIVASTLPAEYGDITSLKNWSRWGLGLIGSAPGFNDWKALRTKIKDLVLTITNNDIGTNWENLDAEEKVIACNFLTNLIPAAKFASTITDPAERSLIALNFDSQSTASRESRLVAGRAYLLGKIGGDNAKKFLDDCIREGNRVFAYIEGIESLEDDGVKGLIDLIDGIGDYDANATDALKGLRHRGYQITDGSGDTLNEVCDTLLGIFNGAY